MQTLIIASLASAAASYAVARLWGPGTLLGAAAAPVIVALVSETLRRPVRTVAATAKRAPAVRSAVDHMRSASDAAADPVLVAEDPKRAAGKSRPRWWLAIATGLVACAIVIGSYTIPDVLTGGSITGNGQPTTFFGGSHTKVKTIPAKTVTTTTPATVTKTTPAPVTKTTTATVTTPTTSKTPSSTTPTTTTPARGAAPPTTTPTTTLP